MKVKSEDSEQITFVTRVRFLYPYLANNVFAIPNGGFRSPKLAALLKRAGVLRGVPDIFVALVRGGCPGLFIEMKRVKGGRLSKDQKIIRAALVAQGYRWHRAEGADEAWEIFRTYIGEDDAADG